MMENPYPIQAFAQRRAHLLARIGEGVAIIPTAPEQARNRDNPYPYRFDSYFWYLTGFPEPEAALVLAGGRSILFCREKDATREIWEGFRHCPEAARAALLEKCSWDFSSS
jgi:Xaa-Pro aminopeptidase